MASLRVLALLFLMSAAGSASARDLRSSDASPSDHPTVRAVEFMGDVVRERTEGRLTISRRAEGERDSESFIVGQLRNGSLDMARVT